MALLNIDITKHHRNPCTKNTNILRIDILSTSSHHKMGYYLAISDGPIWVKTLAQRCFWNRKQWCQWHHVMTFECKWFSLINEIMIRNLMLSFCPKMAPTVSLLRGFPARSSKYTKPKLSTFAHDSAKYAKISAWTISHISNEAHNHASSYSISQEICTRFCCALLCCGYAIVHNEFTWSNNPYSSGLLCWHWGNR